jgi:hypothetical protein
LIRLARDEGADLIVTGAYGHSRLGEWIFGGVTRELLATSPLCCLMSHRHQVSKDLTEREMQTPLEIDFQGMAAAAAIHDAIADRVARLE